MMWHCGAYWVMSAGCVVVKESDDEDEEENNSSPVKRPSSLSSRKQPTSSVSLNPATEMTAE